MSDAIATGRTAIARENKGATPGPVDRRFAFEPHNCFACGSLNTNGLQLDLHVDGERCWTSVALAERFQGWDGIAHGGIVCSILDEVMAWSLVDHDNWGLTARLSVDFKRPVPLGTLIRAEGWITQTRRRLISTAGRIVDPASDVVLATAEATYVAAPEDRKRELKERYGFRLIDAEAAAPDRRAERSQ
jgi:acyl-coenzyme A thioesterase PaaI-like protein